MKALIIGLGFVGGHLKTYLEKQGVEVVHLNHEKLLHKEYLTGFMEKCAPDYIFNLSSYGNIITQNTKDLDEFEKSNVQGWWNLLVTTNPIPYKAFVNVSTSSVTLPVQTIYSSTKAAMEAWCHGFADTFNKPIVSLRPYSLYGEGDIESHFISQVCKALIEDRFIGLDPDPVHDWIHIDDFIEGMWIVAQNAQKLKGKALGLGTGIQTTNLDVVSKLERISDRVLKVDVFDSPRPYDTDHWVCGDNPLKEYGWKPRISLYNGLTRTYKSYENT